MKTYPIEDAGDRLLAFEIPSWRIGRRGVCTVVATIPGAVMLRRPKLFSWFREDTFCEFEVDGERFEVFEPFGDNSRYWIGPKSHRCLPQTDKVREAFSRW